MAGGIQLDSYHGCLDAFDIRMGHLRPVDRNCS
jgi:hypothetical protein